MQRDPEVLRAGFELAVERRRVRGKDESRRSRLLDARRVIEGAARIRDELVAQDKVGLILELGGVADGEAGWVAVPLIVGLADVAQEVQLLGGIIKVNVSGDSVGGSCEIVGTIFYTPQPEICC